MAITTLWRLNGPPIQPRESNSLAAGVSRFESGKYKLAYRSIRKALSLNPDNKKALELKGYMRIVGVPKSENPLRDPMDQFERLYQSYPDSPYLKMMGAELMMSRNNSDQAAALLTSAVSDYPDIPHNWYILGVAQRRLGDKKGAISSFSKAIDIDPQPRYIEALGDSYFFNGDWHSAIGNYGFITSDHKWMLSAKFNRLRGLLFTGQYINTSSFAEKILSVISTNTKIPQKDQNKVKLLTNLSKYEVVSDLSRELLVEYIQTIRDLANQLSDGKSVDTESILQATSEPLKSVILFDISHIIQPTPQG